MAHMFGALNRFIARLDSDPNSATAQAAAPSFSSSAYGFQVLSNPDPGLPLEPWFDFIIGLNGHNIDSPDPDLFLTELHNCAGATISLGVYTAKGRVVREVFVAVPPPEASLGLSLQWCPLSLGDDVWHILDVMPNSPADVAGLLPYGDYILGTPEQSSVRGDAGMGELVEAFLDRPLRLFVYNQEYDVTRLVTLTPAKDWGGDGALGCVLGYGALHRIPAPLAEPSQAPGETLFDTHLSPVEPPPAATGGDYLVPANMQFAAPPSGPSPPPPPSSAGKSRKQRAHHPVSAVGGTVAGLDDYFAEGEKQSRELDNAPKASGEGLPPPPKAGGPPKKSASPAPPASDA